MPYLEKILDVFNQGIVDEIGDESLKPGASPASNNWLDLGDRIEVVRGQVVLGTEAVAEGYIYDTVTVVALDGTSQTYRKTSTKVQRYKESDETWVDVVTGLADERMAFAPYRSPAGSFLWFSSPNTGLYRINVANPDSYTDFYDATKNFKGWIKIHKNRMFLWGDITRTTPTGDGVGNGAILRLSYIDDDWPYTAITSEALATASGPATYSGTLAHPLVASRSLQIVHSSETFTDDGNGVLAGTLGGTGTINYTTGAWSITFASAQGSGAITANYTYEKPKTHGLADFTYSSTRTAGQGDFFFQAETDDEIVDVRVYDGKYYCFHTRSIWLLVLTADDTNATNDVYRRNTGISSRNSAIETGEGVMYVDTANADVRIRTLKFDDTGSQVINPSVSDQLSLTSYNFDDCQSIVFGDFVIFSAKSSGTSYTDTWILYNKKWNLLNKMDALMNCMTVRDRSLIGGSSVTDNMFTMFSGFALDDGPIEASYETNDWNLESTKLKKSKRLVIQGKISISQGLIVEASFDDDEFVEIGTILGTGDYVDTTTSSQYGLDLYGGGTYGGNPGDNTIEVYNYMREFRLSDFGVKFESIKLRFRTESIGYLSVERVIFRDIREMLKRVPQKYRT